MNILKRILSSFIIAGMIILMIGLYYAILKAGIPYQDAPLDLQIQYTVDAGIGKILTITGFCMTAVFAVLRIAAGLIGRKKKQ